MKLPIYQALFLTILLAAAPLFAVTSDSVNRADLKLSSQSAVATRPQVEVAEATEAGSTLLNVANHPVVRISPAFAPTATSGNARVPSHEGGHGPALVLIALGSILFGSCVLARRTRQGARGHVVAAPHELPGAGAKNPAT